MSSSFNDDDSSLLQELQVERVSPQVHANDTLTGQESPEFEHFVRWIKSHRDSVKEIYNVLEHGDEGHIGTVPIFLETLNEQVMAALRSFEQERRAALENITGTFDGVMNKVEVLFARASRRSNQMKRQASTLAVMAEELSRNGREKEKLANDLLHTLKDFEDTRTKILRSIQNPQWEIPHHFHMTALEHFRGNTQPHLIEIAVALPGQLRVCAMAKQTRQANARIFSKFQEAKEERDGMAQRLEEVEKQRKTVNQRLAETQHIVNIMAKKMGPDSKRHCKLALS